MAGDGYIAIVVALQGVMLLFFLIGDRLDFLYIDHVDKKGNKTTIPFMKYLIWLTVGWLSVVLAGFAVRIDSLESYGFDVALTTFYKGTIILLTFISAMFIIGFIYYVLNKIVETADKNG